MKNSFKLITFLLLATALFTSSCSNDDDGNSNGTSTGNFLPLAVGNTWIYDVSNQTTPNTLTITGTETIGGTVYYEVLDDAASEINVTQFFAKKGATYVLRAGDTNVNENGISLRIGAYELPILKDDVVVGTISKGSVSPKVTFLFNGQNQTVPFKVDYELTTVSKESLIVNNITYPNVIKTSLSISIDANGEITKTVQNFWFAENVGIVKTTANNQNVITTETLASYELN